MRLKMTSVALLAAALAGCGNLFDKLTEDEVPHFKTVDGKVAIAALGSTVGEVVGELDTVLSQTGGNLSGPGTVQPPADLFEDEEQPAGAPGFRAAHHEENHLSAWKGPETGPDGVAGWYYREITDTVWDYYDSKQVVARWRYWLRFEPAHDIVALGVKTAKATHTNYGWTGEDGPWGGWRYVIRFGVTSVSTNIDGTTRPATVEGTWLWEILTSAPRYRDSRSEGQYVYTLGGADALEGHDQQDDGEEEDIYFGLANGEKRDIKLSGTGKWSYTGQHSSEDNVIVGKWYGAGSRKTTGNGVVTRTGATTLDVDINFDFETGGFWAQGEKPETIDFTTPPEFSKGVTPAGDKWGVPEWYAKYVDDSLTARDGLLYWYDSKGSFIINSAWDAEKLKAAEDKIEAAQAILDDPDATAEERQTAQTDLNAAWDESEAAYTQQDYQNRTSSHWLTWNGMEDKRDYVGCSSETLAPDCPDDEEKQ